MTLTTSDVTHSTSLFLAAHPNWPGVSPGEYPLDSDGCVIPDEPASKTPALDWLRANTELVSGPMDSEDEYLIRMEGADYE